MSKNVIYIRLVFTEKDMDIDLLNNVLDTNNYLDLINEYGFMS